MVYGACRRITHDAGAAEDIAQECFLKLAQQTAPIRSPGAWLHRVATCASLSWLRDEKRRVRRESDFAQAQAAAQEETDPDWPVLVPLVDKAIDALPENNRSAVILRFLEGKSHAQIGRELGVSRRAVQKRIEKGLEQIRVALAGTATGLTVAGLAALLGLHMKAEAAPPSLVAALGKQTLAAARFSGRAAKTGWITKGATIMTVKKAVTGVLVLVALVLGGASFIFREALMERLSGDTAGESASTQAGLHQIAPGLGTAHPAAKQAQNQAPPREQVNPAQEVSPAAPATEGSQQKPEVTGPPASFSGLVYTGDMRPVPDAQVWLDVTPDAFTEPTSFQTTTGPDGRYMISSVNRFGGAMLYAHAKGHLMEFNQFFLKPGEQHPETNFLLTPAAAHVKGLVVTTAGRPVERAEVSLVSLRTPPEPSQSEPGVVTGGAFSWSPRVNFFTVTAADGSFDIELPMRGSCDFHVRKTGVGEGVFPEVESGTENARFVLTALGAIAGTVTLSDGRPAAGYFVAVIGECPYKPGSAEPPFYSPIPNASITCTTDENGHYKLEEISPQSQYEVGVAKESDRHFTRNERGFISKPLASKADLHVEAGQVLEGIDFQLIDNPYVRLYGHVHDDTTGKPVAGVSIGCSRMSPGKLYGTNRTDDQGAYELSLTLDKQTMVVVFGTYLSVLGGWGAPLRCTDEKTPLTMDLSPGDEKQLDWITDAPLSIPVKAVDPAGAPVPAVWIGTGIVKENGAREFSSSRSLPTDANGQCLIENLPPKNTYFVWAEEHERSGIGKDVVPLAQSEALTVPLGQTAPEVVLVIEDKGGIEGVAVFEDGSPAGEVSLTISAEGSAPVTAVTKSDGAFTAVAAFLPGNYAEITFTATVEGASFTAKLAEVEVVANAIIDLGPIVLVVAP